MLDVGLTQPIRNIFEHLKWFLALLAILLVQIYLVKMFCKQFSESSPCLSGQQGCCSTTEEHSENILPNLILK